MTEQGAYDRKAVPLHPPPAKDFDPFTATEKDLERHGLPLRPDPQTQPGMAALWERQASRYRGYDHLEPQCDKSAMIKKPTSVGASDLEPLQSCGYQLVSRGAAFTALFVTWTVPNLRFSPGGGPNYLRTFVGLGSLDVHVQMTVDSTQNVITQIWAQEVGQVNLPVEPGDVISGALCLATKPPGTAHYFFANETRSQTMNFEIDTGFCPATTINAGVTRGDPNRPLDPLAHFGVVYFDEISAFSLSGSQSLTSGSATTMVDRNGSTLARPVRLTDYAFKAVYAAD